MAVYTDSRVIPYGREQVFDLVADVERYPEFLPWWIAARVRERHGEVYYTDQEVGLRLLRERFSSKTILERPERIVVTSDDPFFRRLELRWRFREAPGGACRVDFRLDVELSSPPLGRLLWPLFGGAASRVVATFERRARELHGVPARRAARPSY